MTTRRVLLACDIDSQVFGALPLALAFAARGWSVTFAIESVRTLPQQLLERLTRDFAIIERSIGALPTEDVVFDQDAVGVFVTGSRLAMFRHLLELSSRVKERPRPALFCNFNGLVFEKFEEGLAWRLGYDVIGLNGPRDRDAFVDFLHSTQYSRQPSVIVGLRRKTDTPPRPLKIPAPKPEPDAAASDDGAPVDAETAQPSPEAAPAEADEPAIVAEAADPRPEDAEDAAPTDAGAVAEDPVEEAASDDAAPVEDAASTPTAAPKKLFVFAEQVVVPRSLRERQNLVSVLARLASASPDWQVVIKARTRPDEQTFHQQPNHISKLVKALRKKPRNLIVSYEPLDDLLDRADLFATVSSTALFDAFDYGVPSMVATDFGLRNADGAHVFFASGLLARLGDLKSLDDAPIRSPDERWMRRMGYGAPYSPDALIDWLETFDPDRPMPAAFVSFKSATHVASGSAAQAGRICEIWSGIETSLLPKDKAEPAAEEHEAAQDEAAQDVTTAAVERRAALFRLASLISDALGSAGPDRGAKAAPPRDGKTPETRPATRTAVVKEGPIASFSRKLGMYWFYKRVRAKLGVPVR
ncbi:DUF6716 putative glycosyltransferase [Chenggangzhangella methanolivorans]|uniref:DUF6716 putative glycosyltransferase n=1 Tax=Chenggangzhangella methanolivorans TaxID=1437009 RepID=UPI003619B5CB